MNNIRFVTDSAGLVAFDEPGLFDQDVYVSVRAFGYEAPKDTFGNRGQALRVVHGGEATLPVKRINLAERLYRVTGGGIYRDTILAGREAPIRHPVLDAKVLGQDSVLTAVYQGKIRWFWGDTNRPSYPLGNFHSPSATSLLPSRGGLDPSVGVDLTYDPGRDGFARPSAKMPGEGPTWLSALTVVPDSGKGERMFATYSKVRGSMQTYQRGFVSWDDSRNEFVKLVEFPIDAPIRPDGHAFRHSVDGVEYVYYASPMPLVRVRADARFVGDLDQYETFTPIKARQAPGRIEIDRDASGKVLYGWKKGAQSVSGSGDLGKLVDRKLLRQNESIAQLRDAVVGRLITAHFGSVNWNEYRKRWVMISVERGGSSYLGEAHSAEADTPIGPWVYARKVATHQDDDRFYSFYNPRHHPEFDKDGGRTIFFEGTYSSTFSGNSDPTPRYDYNQVMYRLDLGLNDLNLPVAVYDLGAPGSFGTGGGDHPERHGQPIAFFARDRPSPGSIPVYASPNAAGGFDLVPREGPGSPVFFALPFESQALPGPSVALREFVHDDGVRHAYSTDVDWQTPGYRRTGRVVCYVWVNPLKVTLPRN